MLATFCLRLACGLLASLILLFPLDVSPRFFRTHFLIALALLGAAGLFGSERVWGWWAALLLALLGTLLGSLTWSLNGAPAGRFMVVFTTLALVAMMGWSTYDGSRPSFSNPGPDGNRPGFSCLLANDLTAAALLGSVTTAMLMGHSYLIAPAMSLTPLMRLLTALFAAIGLRLALASVGLYFWTDGHSLVNLEDVTVLWLPLRWGLGFLGPLVLGWMAREAAKIRSTQSATGILYVAVVFCFLGELTSQLLLSHTGFIL